MMGVADLIRDAPLGQLIRLVTRKRYLLYPEERPDFECPAQYLHSGKLDTILEGQDSRTDTSEGEAVEAVEERSEEVEELTEVVEEVTESELEKVETIRIPRSRERPPYALGRTSTFRTMQNPELEKVSSRQALEMSATLADLEKAYTASALERGPTQPIEPAKLENGTILVDWYTTDDPENPHNWSFGKKMMAATQIYLYTLVVYMGSAIFAPSEVGTIEQFGIGPVTASLGIALYVLAYGLGPMLWSPLSEIPVIGRNPPYIITFGIFVILAIPTALVNNFAGLIVLRFLQGFFGSPCLATGGASLQDMFALIKLPYVLALWAFAATCGPALGPIISGFSVTAENWHWSLWEILWSSAPVWGFLFFCLPETSSPNILLNRAKRLRKLTGNPLYKSQSEIDQGKLTLSNVAAEALYRPFQMMFLDPAVAFTALYTALVYGIFYSFFEAFPLVYIEMYDFNLGEMGLAFLSVTVGVAISMAAYWSYWYWLVEPSILKNGLGAPEKRLTPALLSSFLVPIGLFIFAWTSRPNIHWIAPTIGAGIVVVGIFNIIQCIFLYLPLTYPQYAASLFAGNDLTRSCFACASILFSRPMFLNLGIGSGVSLLAALTAACVAGVWMLFWFGDRLRARSKFAAK